jgi:hypothetical protein
MKKCIDIECDVIDLNAPRHVSMTPFCLYGISKLQIN